MRKPAVIVKSVVAIGVMAVLAVQGCGRRALHTTSEAPTHYFIPEKSGRGNAVWCNFDTDLERSEMPALWSKPLNPCSLGLGWTYPNKGGVVSIAPTGSFDIDLPSDDWSHLLLSVKAFRDPNYDRQQTMSIDLNGRLLGSVEVPARWTIVGLQVPAGVLRRGSNRVSASFGHRVSPSGSPGKRDRRLFAVHLREAALVRSEQSELSKWAMKRMMRKAASPSRRIASVFDRQAGYFVLASPGTLVMPIEIPEDANLLELEMRAEPSTSPDEPRITLRIQNLDPGATPIAALPVENEKKRRGFTVIRKPLGGLAGENCLIMVDVPPRSDGSAIVLSPPRIIRSERPAASEQPAKGPDATQPNPPDIVLITLDAARADHFSCYGYKRRTSPNIDRLAEDSLVFRNAFALAPYTLCSVPTMVTGLSFLDHQVTHHGHKLPDQATTLAEYLKFRGYKTAGFSATPNNSRALGTDQGYDPFVETWKVMPRSKSSYPFILSGLAVQWLAEHDHVAPLHLQLHFVPPHAPYDPGPEFDRFTDPTYQGRYDGRNRTISNLDSAKWIPRPDDLAHVIALYDGNLREVDEAVSQVLEALRRRPRWENTVVLITSDHGEAFLDHGRMSHNSTLFDEMLHVPFILRLPSRFDVQHPALDQLVTLADIVPTLLATAALEPEPGLAGINLLDPAGGKSSNGRYLVARTTGNNPIYGLRNLRWKLMLGGSGQGALFNPELDPGENNDLVLDDRATFYGLGRLLTQRLAEPPALEPAVNVERLSDEDAAMLKALGYLN